MADARPRSGEYPISADEARRMASEAADAAVARAMLNGEKDNGRRDAMLDNMLLEIKGLRSDIQPLMITQAQHQTMLRSMSEQLQALKEHGDQTATHAVEAASKAAKAIFQDEVIAGLKETRASWKSVIPGVVGTLVSSLIAAICAYALAGGFAKDEAKPAATQTGKTP